MHLLPLHGITFLIFFFWGRLHADLVFLLLSKLLKTIPQVINNYINASSTKSTLIYALRHVLGRSRPVLCSSLARCCSLHNLASAQSIHR